MSAGFFLHWRICLHARKPVRDMMQRRDADETDGFGIVCGGAAVWV